MRNEKILFSDSKDIYDVIKFIISLCEGNTNDDNNVDLYNNIDKIYFSYNMIIFHKELSKQNLIISIVPNVNEFSLFYNFYSNLLINDNQNRLINYKYELSYIEGLYRQVFENNNNSEIKNAIMAKFIIDLVKYKNINNKLVDKIKYDMKEKRDTTLCFNKKINFENDIEEIYAEIIILLIKEKKIENYSQSYYIITQLELEKINITNVIFDKILKFLEINKDDINKNYGIINIKDLFLDIKKINFYYSMLKYILKNSIYIYNIPLFRECKKIIMNSKSQLKYLIDFDSLANESNTINGRLIYIIKTFLDSKYYIKKYLSLNYYNEEKDKKESSETYNKLLNKKSTLIFSNQSYLNSSHEEYENNLKKIDYKIRKKEFNFDNSIVIFHTNEKGKEPFIIYEQLFFESDENEFIIFDEFSNYIKNNNREEYESKDFLNFLNEIQNELKNDFVNNDKIYNGLEEDSLNYSCFYILYNPENLDEKWKEYKDLKIFNGELNGLFVMINELNNENYQNIKYMKYFKESPNNIMVKNNNGVKVLLLKNFKIIGNQDIIKKRDVQFYTIEVIKLDDNNNQIYINDSKIEERKVKIVFCDNENNNIKYFVSYNSNIHIIYYNNKNNLNIHTITIKNNDICNFMLKYNNNQYILGGNNGVYNINNIENEIELELDNKKKIISEKFKGVIEIKNYLLIFFSDIYGIKIFDKNLNNFIENISEYSIISSPNNSLFMEMKHNNNKIILCACKKTSTENERGILLIYIINQRIFYHFYPLEHFDIYCFCKIKTFDDNFILKKEETKIQFLLIGGYCKKTKSGLIKLYRAIISNNFETKIQFINNIEINSNNNGHIFKHPISCIIQNYKYLLFTCSNNSYKFEFDINLI